MPTGQCGSKSLWVPPSSPWGHAKPHCHHRPRFLSRHLLIGHPSILHTRPLAGVTCVRPVRYAQAPEPLRCCQMTSCLWLDHLCDDSSTSLWRKFYFLPFPVPGRQPLYLLSVAVWTRDRGHRDIGRHRCRMQMRLQNVLSLTPSLCFSWAFGACAPHGRSPGRRPGPLADGLDSNHQSPQGWHFLSLWSMPNPCPFCFPHDAKLLNFLHGFSKGSRSV